MEKVAQIDVMIKNIKNNKMVNNLNLDSQSILYQFKIIEESLRRAKLPFEVDLMNDTSLEVTLYELIKTREQILNMIRDISPDRFAPYTTPQLVYPEPTLQHLNICPYCGNPDCTSDHK